MLRFKLVLRFRLSAGITFFYAETIYYVENKSAGKAFLSKSMVISRSLNPGIGGQ
jgi:hypothetical protein